MNRSQNWKRLIAAGVLHPFGNVPIPEWDDDDIDFVEHLDVHRDGCRCSDCQGRSVEVRLQQACRKAKRELAVKNAKADKARHEPAKARARSVPPVIPGSVVIPVGADPELSLAQIRAETAKVARETAKLAREVALAGRLLSGEELIRYMEYRQRECAAKVRPDAA